MSQPASSAHPDEHGTKIRALNDRGDDSPEGELTDGVLDQLAKFERAKTAERTRRGKLRKAKQGKIIAGRRPNYGFKFNDTRDGYEVEEHTMSVVRRIFRMAGVDGLSVNGIKRALDAEGVPTPSGRKYWHWRAIQSFIMDDVYRPHAFEEVADLLMPEVAATLNPSECYGVWWYNRQRVKWSQVSEAGPEGKIYRKRGKYSIKDRSEWIAVPVPDAGIPRQVVEAARQTVLSYRATSKAAGRVWELSGCIMRCALCGRAMNPQKTGYTRKSGDKGYVLYYRCPRAYGYDGECSHRKNHRADKLEPAIWELVSGLLKEPERIREGLERLIEEERRRMCGNPVQEQAVWLRKVAEADQRRASFQDMAAEGLITFDELRTKLAALEETRQLARRELASLQGQRDRLQELERDKTALLEHYSAMVPEGLDALSPEERHRVYKMLRLKVNVQPSGILEVSGTFGEGLELRGGEPTPQVGPAEAQGNNRRQATRNSRGMPGFAWIRNLQVLRGLGRGQGRKIPRPGRLRKGGHGARVHAQGLPHLGWDLDRRGHARRARGHRGPKAGREERALGCGRGCRASR